MEEGGGKILIFNGEGEGEEEEEESMLNDRNYLNETTLHNSASQVRQLIDGKPLYMQICNTDVSDTHNNNSNSDDDSIDSNDDTRASDSETNYLSITKKKAQRVFSPPLNPPQLISHVSVRLTVIIILIVSLLGFLFFSSFPSQLNTLIKSITNQDKLTIDNILLSTKEYYSQMKESLPIRISLPIIDGSDYSDKTFSASSFSIASHTEHLHFSPHQSQTLPVSSRILTHRYDGYSASNSIQQVNSMLSELNVWPPNIRVDLLIRTYWRPAASFAPLFASIQLFWPKHIGRCIIIIDKNSEDELLSTILPDWCDLIEEQVPEYMIDYGYWAQQWSNFWSDNYTDADYVVISDTDAYFSTPVTPDLMFDKDGKAFIPIIPMEMSYFLSNYNDSFSFWFGNLKDINHPNHTNIRDGYPQIMMSRLPMVIHRSVFPSFRDWLMNGGVHSKLINNTNMKCFNDFNYWWVTKDGGWKKPWTSQFELLLNYWVYFSPEYVSNKGIIQDYNIEYPFTRYSVHLPHLDAYRYEKEKIGIKSKYEYELINFFGMKFLREGICTAFPPVHQPMYEMVDYETYEYQPFYRSSHRTIPTPDNFDMNIKDRKYFFAESSWKYSTIKRRNELLNSQIKSQLKNDDYSPLLNPYSIPGCPEMWPALGFVDESISDYLFTWSNTGLVYWNWKLKLLPDSELKAKLFPLIDYQSYVTRMRWLQEATQRAHDNKQLRKFLQHYPSPPYQKNPWIPEQFELYKKQIVFYSPNTSLTYLSRWPINNEEKLFDPYRTHLGLVLTSDINWNEFSVLLIYYSNIFAHISVIFQQLPNSSNQSSSSSSSSLRTISSMIQEFLSYHPDLTNILTWLECNSNDNELICFTRFLHSSHRIFDAESRLTGLLWLHSPVYINLTEFSSRYPRDRYWSLPTREKIQLYETNGQPINNATSTQLMIRNFISLLSKEEQRILYSSYRYGVVETNQLVDLLYIPTYNQQSYNLYQHLESWLQLMSNDNFPDITMILGMMIRMISKKEGKKDNIFLLDADGVIPQPKAAPSEKDHDNNDSEKPDTEWKVRLFEYIEPSFLSPSPLSVCCGLSTVGVVSIWSNAEWRKNGRWQLRVAAMEEQKTKLLFERKKNHKK